MSMAADGLLELRKELSKLSQVAANEIDFGDADEHSDLENAIADVYAAISFVVDKHNLSRDRIIARWTCKLEQYSQRDNEGRDDPA